MPPTGTTDVALTARLDAAIEAARVGGEVTLEYFQSPALVRETKRDGSVVTHADRQAEHAIRDHLRRLFPDDGLLGEEHEDEPGTSGYRWIIDPIDGTVSFVRGVPLYGTLVALQCEDSMLAGVIHMPALDEMVYAAVGGGAWHVSGEQGPIPARVSSVSDVDQAIICATAVEYFAGPDEQRRWLQIVNQAGGTRGWSDCYAHLLVATGRAEAVVESSISPWDIAASFPIMREAGGRCSDWSGRAHIDSKTCLASNGHIHNDLLRILSGSTKP